MPRKKQASTPRATKRKLPETKQEATTSPKNEQTQEQPKRKRRGTILPDPDNIHIEVIGPRGQITDEAAEQFAALMHLMEDYGY